MTTADNTGLNADLDDDLHDDDRDLGDGGQDNENDNDDDGEVVITLGDAPPPGAEDETQEEAEAPRWVKELRKTNRELARKLKEAEARTSASQQQQEPEAPVLGDKPTLEGSNYDEDEYQAALDKWYDKKQEVAKYQEAQQRKVEEAKAGQQKVMDDYTAAAKKLKVPDFKAAEGVVIEHLSQDQQGLILNGADDPAKLVYVLGRHPEKLKAIASITNPVKFAFAVSKLEGEIKVSKRDKPAPESGRVSNSSTTSRNNTVDKTLERLEKEADVTGDRTKILEYKRSLKK